jgi:hypothetical protein
MVRAVTAYIVCCVLALVTLSGAHVHAHTHDLARARASTALTLFVLPAIYSISVGGYPALFHRWRRAVA